MTAQSPSNWLETQTTSVRWGGALAALMVAGVALASGFFWVRAVRNAHKTLSSSPHAVVRPADEPWLAPATDVILKTPKGVELRGWGLSSSNGAAVMLVHGSDNDRTQLLYEAHALAAAGYGILMMDRPGNGESEGLKLRSDELDFMRVEMDTLAAARGVDPSRIGAFGFSSGAAFLAEEAARDSRIRAVVLAACYTDDDQYIFHFGGQGPIDGVSALLAARWSGFVFPHPLAVLPAIAPRPVFFITGDRDMTVPPQSSADLYRGAPGPKELWVVHRAEHGNYAQVAGEEYARRLVSFFDRALLGREGARDMTAPIR